VPGGIARLRKVDLHGGSTNHPYTAPYTCLSAKRAGMGCNQESPLAILPRCIERANPIDALRSCARM